MHRKFGIEIEARHREALHSAIMSGALRVVELGGDRNEILKEALFYAKRSVPDAIRGLAAEDRILRELAEAKLQQVAGQGR